MALKLKVNGKGSKTKSKTKLKLNIKEPTPKIKETPEVVLTPIKNLHDAIDRDRLFKMIYSGVENKKYFKILYDLGIRDFLISYHYVQEKKLDMEYYKSLGIKFFIDSGAYTYQGQEKYQDKPKEYWEKQIVRYLSWAKAHKDVIFAIANLDLENLFDFETTVEWNKKYFEPFMLETGIPVCFIWHPCDEDEGWEYYTKRYPYTGFSWVADSGQDLDFNFGKRMLDVARKNNSVCHGMGMTRTSLLTKLPFYTSDSTTWLVGLQYGEVNYWNGKKMSRLKKDKWKGEYLNDLVSKGCNKQKLLDEVPEEMIKANIIAFKEAQEYIDTRLKPRMYWLQPVATKRDVNSEEIYELFPNKDWMESEEVDPEEAREYARKLNINPDLDDSDEVASLVYDLTLVCMYEQYDMEETLMENIEGLHDEYINRVVGSNEERLEDLKKFFWAVVSGSDSTLLLKGIKEEAKERDSYMEEPEYEEVEIDESEYLEVLTQNGFKALPSEAPEVDELDREIFDQTGYSVVRDDKGRFVKGQKMVKKPKNIYSEKYPKLACDTCYSAQTCPHFKEGYVCAFNKMFKRFDVRRVDDIIEAMQGMANLNMERMQRVAIFEMLDGGLPDSTLTNMIDQNMRILSQMKDVYDSQPVVRQVRTVGSDGSIQETTQVNSNAPVGVMEQLMKSMLNNSSSKDSEDQDKDTTENIVDVEPEDVNDINKEL